ncbi:MAG: Stp1/IreP family PP2C-type Ser/Thr phosphatase [Candidatus Promineifilaceae bacterium]
MTISFTIEAVAGTDPGMIRKINQDSVLAYVRPNTLGEAIGLLIVADGMGGHQAGDVASKLAVDTIRDNLSWLLDQGDEGATVIAPSVQSLDEEREVSKLEARLVFAIEEANRAIYAYSQEHPARAGNLGCTITCAIVQGDTAVVANVGDSRTYYLGQKGLVQITDDHSYVGQLVRDGHLEESEIYAHPQRNVITRALGSQEEVTVDTWICTLNDGDRLMLCSDGVWEMIQNSSEIEDILKLDNLELAVDEMIKKANEYGGTDNIGVVIAEVFAEELDL